MKTREEKFKEYKLELLRQRKLETEIIEDTSFEDFENTLNLKDNDEAKMYHAVQDLRHEDEGKQDYVLIEIENYFNDKLSEINIG